MSRLVGVTLSGCDDSTQFNFKVDDAGFSVLLLLQEASEQASGYGCQPVLTVAEPFADEEDES